MFNHIVAKYGGDKYVKHFTCWNQLLTLMFGQLVKTQLNRLISKISPRKLPW